MLKIEELRVLARRVGCDAFVREVGPFTLVQRPPKALLALASQQLGVGETIPFQRGKGSVRALDLVLSFNELVIATLPPVREQDELAVGRLPDCDVVIENPSVSKRHAVLSWSAHDGRATVVDLQSRNGTRLDGRMIPPGDPRQLSDEDVVSFGDVDYWFLLTPTLHRKLLAQK